MRVSAKELREAGIPVPANVPDDATIPRSAVRMCRTVDCPEGELHVTFQFHEPFTASVQRVEISGRIVACHGSSTSSLTQTENPPTSDI